MLMPNPTVADLEACRKANSIGIVSFHDFVRLYGSPEAAIQAALEGEMPADYVMDLIDVFRPNSFVLIIIRELKALREAIMAGASAK